VAASDTALNQSLDGLGGSLPGSPVNLLAFVSLHTAAPSAAGSNETKGGSYARQACSWNNAATHAKTNSSALSFSTVGTAITDAGTFSASSAGTFGIGIHLGTPVTATTITVAAGALSIAGAAT
jgi:hypothetical protein